MKKLQLFRNGQEILATDGILPVDRRLGINRIREEVIARNSRFEKNFPHKIADSFAIYGGNGRIDKNNLGKIYSL